MVEDWTVCHVHKEHSVLEDIDYGHFLVIMQEMIYHQWLHVIQQKHVLEEEGLRVRLDIKELAAVLASTDIIVIMLYIAASVNLKE